MSESELRYRPPEAKKRAQAPELQAVPPDSRTDEEAQKEEQIRLAEKTIAQYEARLENPRGLKDSTIERYKQVIDGKKRWLEKLRGPAIEPHIQEEPTADIEAADIESARRLPPPPPPRESDAYVARIKDLRQELKQNGQDISTAEILNLGQHIAGKNRDAMMEWLEESQSQVTREDADILTLLKEAEDKILKEDPRYLDLRRAMDDAVRIGQPEMIDTMVDRLREEKSPSLLSQKRTEAILLYAESLMAQRQLRPRLEGEFANMPLHNPDTLLNHFIRLKVRIENNITDKAKDPITADQLTVAQNFFQDQLTQAEQQFHILDTVWQQAEAEENKYTGVAGFVRGLVDRNGKAAAAAEAARQRVNHERWERTMGFIRQWNDAIKNLRPDDVATQEQIAPRAVPTETPARDHETAPKLFLSQAYEILGTAADVSDAELRSAYRRLSRKLHPDVVPENERPAAQTRFQEMKEAYDMIQKHREQEKQAATIQKIERLLVERETLTFADRDTAEVYVLLSINQKRGNIQLRLEDGRQVDFPLDDPWTIIHFEALAREYPDDTTPGGGPKKTSKKQSEESPTSEPKAIPASVESSSAQLAKEKTADTPAESSRQPEKMKATATRADTPKSIENKEANPADKSTAKETSAELVRIFQQIDEEFGGSMTARRKGGLYIYEDRERRQMTLENIIANLRETSLSPNQLDRLVVLYTRWWEHKVKQLEAEFTAAQQRKTAAPRDKTVLPIIDEVNQRARETLKLKVKMQQFSNDEFLGLKEKIGDITEPNSAEHQRFQNAWIRELSRRHEAKQIDRKTFDDIKREINAATIVSAEGYIYATMPNAQQIEKQPLVKKEKGGVKKEKQPVTPSGERGPDDLGPSEYDLRAEQRHDTALAVLRQVAEGAELSPQEQDLLIQDSRIVFDVQQYYRDGMPLKQILGDVVIPSLDHRLDGLLGEISAKTQVPAEQLDPTTGRPKTVARLLRKKSRADEALYTRVALINRFKKNLDGQLKRAAA